MRGLKLIGIILAALLLPAQIPANAQENIRIGVLLPLTGPLAKNGLENWEAMQIARDMINERGGIQGRKIEYLQGDANTPNAAISETERLITKDAIKITTGSFASPIAIAVSRPRNVTASFIGRRQAPPKSSRGAASSIPFRSARPRANMARPRSISSSTSLPSGSTNLRTQ